LTIKVNIGSGIKVVSGWINYDVSIHISLAKHKRIAKLYATLRRKPNFESQFPTDLAKMVIRRDIRKGIPLKDGSVDFIYCSHCLEHLTFEEGSRLLGECHRTLKQQGWIRVVVPDLRWLAQHYLKQDLTFFQASPETLSRAFIDRLDFSDKRPRIMRFLFPKNPHQHRSMYDFGSLRDLFAKTGFSNIEERKPKVGVVPDIQLLDADLGIESLFLEGQKD
jgi:hypothetical protein